MHGFFRLFHNRRQRGEYVLRVRSEISSDDAQQRN